jgi:hypothetical protein
MRKKLGFQGSWVATADWRDSLGYMSSGHGFKPSLGNRGCWSG